MCEITEVVNEKKLTSSWRYEGYQGVSYITFELFEDGVNTKIKLTHDGLETFPANNKDFAKVNFAKGWNHIINTSLFDFSQKIPDNKQN